jgi:hypothetical protein
MGPLTSSFDPLSAAELHASHSCVCFGFWGLALSFLELGLSGFVSLLFQLLRVIRELAYFTPFAHKAETMHLNL